MPLLKTYIEKFKQVRILVIGDIMLDRFIYGNVERISPEAPVPVFKYKSEKEMLGGAGNVVANLAKMGCMVKFIGIIGRDESGEKIAKQLKEIGAHVHLLKLENYQTIVKTRLIAGNNHLTRVDQEEILPVIEGLLPRYQRILNQAVKNADIVLVSDYNKGLLTSVTTPMIIQTCHNYHKKVIVDPKGADYSKYIGATLIKPNLKEFSQATGCQYNPTSADFQQQIQQKAKDLFQKYHIEHLIITLSEYGMIHVDAANDLLQIPTEAKEVYDVSGAGDTSLATIGAALGAGAPVKEAMKLANLAAGIAVGKLGTATVSAKELENALSIHQSAPDGWQQKRKIITLEQAEEIVKAARENHQTIGFTNGCFDCCHLGHLHSLMEAKKLCDVLIVGVNSDESVRGNKGPLRPIQDEKTRAMLLASLVFVDYVIVFDDKTPMEIVEKLKPDIIAKEGYALENWPEGRLVQSYGGKVVTLRRLEGYSTTNLIQKMKG